MPFPHPVVQGPPTVTVPVDGYRPGTAGGEDLHMFSGLREWPR
jgi:hypothetical protein